MKFFVFVIFIASASSSAIAEASDELWVRQETLFLSGSSAPGTPEGVTIRIVTGAAIDEVGNVLFEGILAGPGTDEQNPNGAWIFANGTAGLLNLRDVTILLGNSIAGNDGVFSNGKVLGAERAGLSFPSFYWLGDTSGLLPIGIQGSRLDGMAVDETVGVPVGQGSPSVRSGLNPSGKLAFTLPILKNGVSNGAGVWFGDKNTQALALRSGQQAPGFAPGIIMHTEPDGCCLGPLYFEEMTDAGEIALIATLAGNGVNGSNSSAVWFGQPTSLQLVAREGDTAPGLGNNAAFSHFIDATVNRSSWATIHATTRNPSIEGLWVTDGNITSLVAAVGQPAPGFEDIGAKFTDIFRTTAPTSSGRIAFAAQVSTGAIGVWAGGPGDLEKIVVSGQLLPGDPGVEFTMQYFDVMHLDDAGRLKISGEGNGQDGQWLVDPSGVFHSIFREGELIEVAPGDFRRIRNYTHRNDNVNYAGQITTALIFEDDSSAIIRWQLVPEPSALMLAVLCLGVYSCRRHR